MVEAAGVERFRLLTARKVMILGTATMAKEALLPDPLSVYCTKIFSRGSSVDATLRLSIRFARNGSRKKLSTVFRQSFNRMLTLSGELDLECGEKRRLDMARPDSPWLSRPPNHP